jgi:hypothetical protein
MPARKTEECDAMVIDPRDVLIVEAFAEHRDVSQENRKGFGSGALKVNAKISAMISSKRQFVVKLPKNRVDELENQGKGQRFDPGHGRIMKEWFVAGRGKADWVGLGREAYDFVKQGKL